MKYEICVIDFSCLSLLGKLLFSLKNLTFGRNLIDVNYGRVLYLPGVKDLHLRIPIAQWCWHKCWWRMRLFCNCFFMSHILLDNFFFPKKSHILPFCIFYFGTVLFQIFGDIWKHFFPAVWAFHIYSCLSGCGMPWFFLVRHFSILGLCIFSNFWGYLKRFFFQLFGHFISTHVWVDVECPNLFLVRYFFILGLCIFSNFWGFLRYFFF